MPIETTANLVARARSRGGAVLAFNVVTLEHAEGIAAGAERAEQAAILQISQNAVRYHGSLAPIAAATRAVARAATVPLALHLDHVADEQLLHQAVGCEFSSAMFDAADLPYDENVRRTSRAAAWAHEHGLWLEAELGYVGGKAGAAASAHAEGVRTDPAEAAAFVAATGVDALAVAVGSSHAMAQRTAVLDLELIARLRAAVPVPLVLHGSSGVPVDVLRRAVAAGMTKINVGTALNVAFTAALRGVAAERHDPRQYLAPARDAVAGVVADLLSSSVSPV